MTALHVRLPLWLGLGALTLPLAGCGTTPSAPPPVAGRVSGPGSGPAVLHTVPAGFLSTEYAPLQRWLDERFEVEYRNLTPELVFEQSPISDIRYATSGLPRDAPLFHLKSTDLSRREILHRIAAHWNLGMSIEADNDTPSYVRVTGPGGADSGGTLAAPSVAE